jgi:hypothetical protein
MMVVITVVPRGVWRLVKALGSGPQVRRMFVSVNQTRMLIAPPGGAIILTMLLLDIFLPLDESSTLRHMPTFITS